MIRPARDIAPQFYAALLSAAILVGFREAMAQPFLTLFAVDRAHLGPVALGAFVTVRAISGVLFSMACGAWFDRMPGVKPLLLSLAAGALAYALLAGTTDLAALLVIGALPLGASSAAFPQIFALAKAHGDGHDRVRAERRIAVIRASFSVAWAIGPAVGALVMAAFDYSGLFLTSALCGLLACLPFAWGRFRAPPQQARANDRIPHTSLGVGIAAAGLTLFAMAMFMGMIALPIVVTQDLHGTPGDVGLIASLCALLEVPVMAAVALRPAAFGSFAGLAAGFVAFVLFFVLAAWAPSVNMMLAAQVLRATGIGLVTCAGISYVQDLMPGRAGAAAALYSNTSLVGSLLAGVAAGPWALWFGYRSMFLACAAQAAIGLVLFACGARPVRVPLTRSHLPETPPA